MALSRRNLFWSKGLKRLRQIGALRKDGPYLPSVRQLYEQMNLRRGQVARPAPSRKRAAKRFPRYPADGINEGISDPIGGTIENPAADTGGEADSDCDERDLCEVRRARAGSATVSIDSRVPTRAEGEAARSKVTSNALISHLGMNKQIQSRALPNIPQQTSRQGGHSPDDEASTDDSVPT